MTLPLLWMRLVIIRADAAHCRGEAGLLSRRCSTRALGGNFSLHVLDRAAKVSILFVLSQSCCTGDRCLEIFSVDAGKLGRLSSLSRPSLKIGADLPLAAR